MRYSVLVVDDDPILTELYAQMLVNAGFDVTRTRSVRDALRPSGAWVSCGRCGGDKVEKRHELVFRTNRL